MFRKTLTAPLLLAALFAAAPVGAVTTSDNASKAPVSKAVPPPVSKAASAPAGKKEAPPKAGEPAKAKP